jgi:hypothetical protein
MRAQRSKALVRAWLDFLPPAQRPLAERVRELALGAEPALEESIKWGNLVLALDGGRPCWRWPPTRPGCTCAAWAAAKAPSRRPPTVACACATASLCPKPRSWPWCAPR